MKKLKRLLACALVFVLAISLLPASAYAMDAADNPSSYGYDQTDAESVTVNVTISSDGVPLMGNDEDSTILSNLEVTVPYFDLALYGYEDYYRYKTNDDGSYDCSEDNIVKRPTAFHLYIYLLERYYLGLSEAACCKGALSSTEYSSSYAEVYNMWGNTAYETSTALSPLVVTGSSTSLYMQNFWGHDENLMYYRNHRYPLQREGWGSTCDYILLSDGDKIDLGMFGDWDFYHTGGFTCFDHDTYTKTTGTSFEVATLTTNTSAANDGSSALAGFSEGVDVALYDANWNCVDSDISYVGASAYGDFSEDANYYEVDLTGLEPGTYHLVGITTDSPGEKGAKYAPATATVNVEPAAHVHELVHHEAVSADCGHEGNIEYWSCSLCGGLFADAQGETVLTSDQVFSPMVGEHVWSDYEVTTPASCTSVGKETSACSVCGVTRVRDIPATGHALGIESTVWSTDKSEVTLTLACTEVDWHAQHAEWKKTFTLDTTCQETKAPTCTEQGERVYSAVLPAGSDGEGATYGTWPQLSVSTVETVPATGHSVQNVPAVKATCTCAGVSAGTKCSTCGKILSGCQAVSATGHSWGAWKTVKASTLLVKGSAKRTCSKCGAIQTKALTLKTPKAGMSVTLGAGKYVIANAVKRTVKYAGPAKKTVLSATVPATVKLQGKTYKVVGISPRAFKGSKATRVIVKSKALVKKTVKNCFRNSRVKAVKVSMGSKAVNKRYVKAYKKIFTKANCGKKVTVS